MDSSRPEIVIFDVEAVRETIGGTKAILEFGAIIVCPQMLVEKEYFSSLVRPQHDWEFGGFHKRKNGLTREDIILANITFSDIARTVYDFLNGRIWVGHNIIEHDRVLVEQAFHKIGQLPPKPLRVIDTLDLCQGFIWGPVNRKMKTVAEYFDLGKQTHRALDDVRLNLRLFVHCAAVFSLTESLSLLGAQDDNTNNNNNNSFPRFPDPREFSIPTLRDESYDSFNKVREPISCASLNVRFGIDIKFWHEDRSPKLIFMVDSPDNLSTKLDEFDWMLQGLFSTFRIDSGWRKVVDRKWKSPAVRLRITNTADEQTIVCKREASGKTRRLVFKDYEGELQTLLTKGTRLDAYLFVETYHYPRSADPTQEKGSAGIRLVAHKLIIHP